MNGDLFQVGTRLKFAGLAFIAVLVIGTLSFKYIGGDDTTYVDSFYMTGITISTVGFKEVIDMTDKPAGRIFTIVFAFTGFGVLTYFLSNLVALFIEGDIKKTFTKRKMEKKISQMEDHFIICGVGRVGRNIADELYDTNRDFVLADSDREVLEELVSENWKGTPYASGDCTDEQFLKELGTEKARGVFVTAGSDNTNLVICLTARQINPSVRIISRGTNIANIKKLKRAGANRVISPNYIGGIRMASEMVRPAVTSFLDEMMRSEINQRLEEFVVTEKLDGKTVEDVPLDDLRETLILAVRDDDHWVYNPPKDLDLKEGMHIVLMTSIDDRKKLEDRLG